MTRSPSLPPFKGRLLVVGGQCRNVGKTALVVDLLRALNEFPWTAVKITPHVESASGAACPLNGPNCPCAPGEHTFAIREESVGESGAAPDSTTDTSRFLQAGARRAIWVQTKIGKLADALTALAALLQPDSHLLIESNAIIEFWRPALFLMVVDPRQTDFKQSARNLLPLVDLFVFRSPFSGENASDPVWGVIATKPNSVQLLAHPLPEALQTIARQRITRRGHPASI